MKVCLVALVIQEQVEGRLGERPGRAQPAYVRELAGEDIPAQSTRENALDYSSFDVRW